MITGAADAALEEAIAAKFKAVVAISPEMRREYEAIANKWLELADGYKRAEKLSGYIEWRSRRLNDHYEAV